MKRIKALAVGALLATTSLVGVAATSQDVSAISSCTLTPLASSPSQPGGTRSQCNSQSGYGTIQRAYVSCDKGAGGGSSYIVRRGAWVGVGSASYAFCTPEYWRAIVRSYEIA